MSKVLFLAFSLDGGGVSLKGRSVIERGAKWRVGNGESIKIWGANWLPTTSTSGVHGPLKVEFQEAKVSSLIDPVSCTWMSHVLVSALSPTDVELVQKISLSRGQAEDALFWPYVQSGQYTAKSGYFFLKTKLRSTPTTICNPPIQPKPLWKQIWSLSLPSKTKNFLWRACHNALPTKENLVKRCIITDPTCSFCSTQAEDVLHAVWCCLNVSQVWDGDPQWHFLRASTHSNFPQLLSSILASDCDTEMFAMTAWTLWLRRNKSSFSPPGVPLEQVLHRAYEGLQDFRIANQPARQQQSRQSSSPSVTVTTTVASQSQQPPHQQQQQSQPETLVLRLNRKKKKVTWKEDTVDNEFMQKKSSKKCCIFHKQKPFDDDDTDSDSDRDRDHDPDPDHDHDHNHDHASCSSSHHS
ncbi:hypothetical protein SO802_003391 [Lithocarpus litseifolius]|uniref:Reverse transcriptase zinc-binding domain-containing protein n=1 Tax=Lithocarpus litseifolius TaxID=425828 RepID=A0AAW2E2M2_9ROSI